MLRSADKNAVKGSALFIILIAVALFAALGYAISQSGRSGSGSISRETVQIEAARIISYAGQIRQAVDRMRLVNGCSDTNINFIGMPPLWSANNPSSPADKSCHVFDAAGGGVPIIRFKTDSFTTPVSAGWTSYFSTFPLGYATFNSYNQLNGIGTTSGVDTSGVDLVFQIFPLSTDTCKEINRQLGLNGPSFAPTSATIYTVYNFTGVYSNGVTLSQYAPSVFGGCYYETSYAMNVYLLPLIER